MCTWMCRVLLLVAGCSAVCQKIQLQGTKWHIEREGTYVLDLNLTCNDRPVYVQESSPGDNYVYYIRGQYSYVWSGWMVGTGHCVNLAGIAAEDDAESPDKVDAVWEETSNNEWQYNTDLKVSCSGVLDTGAIAGIVVGCVMVVIVVIIIIACCCKKRKGSRRPSNRGTTTTTTSGVNSVSYPVQQASFGMPLNNMGQTNNLYPTQQPPPYPTQQHAPYPTQQHAPYPTHQPVPYPTGQPPCYAATPDPNAPPPYELCASSAPVANIGSSYPVAPATINSHPVAPANDNACSVAPTNDGSYQNASYTNDSSSPM